VAIVFLFLFFINAPYGRYTNRSWGFLVNAKFIWFAMEFPAAGFHFLFWVTHRACGVPIHVFMPLLQMRDLHWSIIFQLLISSSAKLIPMWVREKLGLWLKCSNSTA
jgi:3-oxo-5-alpha-steroid 4-dehydrogenase 1